jgi:hypothetical protein
MNESSHKPICEPTKRMDSDAELPNNLSPNKTRVTYSEPKQDAKLPSNIIDSTDTQICWLCHTSEKTNGRQQLPHSENSEGGRLGSLLLSGHKSVGIQPTSLCLTNNLRQSRSFVDNVLIDWWQCRINKVDLKFLSSCLIDHAWQCRSDFQITLSSVDQSPSTSQISVGCCICKLDIKSSL